MERIAVSGVAMPKYRNRWEAIISLTRIRAPWGLFRNFTTYQRPSSASSKWAWAPPRIFRTNWRARTGILNQRLPPGPWRCAVACCLSAPPVNAPQTILIPGAEVRPRLTAHFPPAKLCLDPIARPDPDTTPSADPLAAGSPGTVPAGEAVDPASTSSSRSFWRLSWRPFSLLSWGPPLPLSWRLSWGPPFSPPSSAPPSSRQPSSAPPS